MNANFHEVVSHNYFNGRWIYLLFFVWVYAFGAYRSAANYAKSVAVDQLNNVAVYTS